jgi:hypothetical protein
VLLNVGLAVVLTASVLAPERNSVRSLLSLQAVALLALATPAAIPSGQERAKRRVGRPADSLAPS